MKIGIGNDHRGIELKGRIINYLTSKGIECVNYGCDVKDSSDYVDYALKVCNGVKNHEVDLGILVCGTGIGMSIAANKVKGILAAKVNTPSEAALCREHNRANVMTLAEYTENLEEILDNYINTMPSTEERHIRRVEKIYALEDKNE
jgi:ribose 5-phosphate isomerase B